MPAIELEWKGIPAFKSSLNGTQMAIWNASRASLIQLAAITEAEAKKNFSGSHKRGQPHVGGAQPNIVTGNLRRSITHSQAVSIEPGIYMTQIWPDAVYARAVELGNPKANSGAYPYFAPAVRAMRLRTNEVLAAAWAKYV